MRKDLDGRVNVVGVLFVAVSLVGCTSSSSGAARSGSAAARSGSRVSSTRTTAASATNPFRIGRPLVIPHGGGDGLFPEDTIYAYEHSMSMGGDVVDADVQLTVDAVPVAFHDDTLERTTNGTGNVADKTYAELATLDAGWGFAAGSRHPFRGKGITIPTIESLLQRFPRRLVTLDLKDLRTSAVAPLCTLLRATQRTGNVYIGVDTAEQVQLFRQQCPEVATSGTDDERRAARAARAANDTSFVSRQLVSQPSLTGSDGSKRITPESLAFAHRSDTAVLTWVVDDPNDMRTLINMGIDGIYTRRPDVMAKLLASMGYT